MDRLKKVMTESYPDKVLKDIDGRTATKAPWQKSQRKKKPFHKKRTSSAKMAEELDEEEDEEDEEDINALDGDDYDEDEWYDEEADEEYDEEVDEDQVAYVDDNEGWFYADEDTINVVDEMLTQDDDEFAAILTTYTEARGALAQARIARGFYPVVVPADLGPQPRFGRRSGKGGKRKV